MEDAPLDGADHTATAATGIPKRPPCLWDTAGVCSRLSFSWPYPILVRGAQQASGGSPLCDDDLPMTHASEESAQLCEKLEAAWSRECSTQRKPSLLRAILRAFGSEIIKYCTVAIFELIAFVLQALVLRWLMDSVASASGGGGPQPTWQAFVAAGLFSLASLICTFAHAWFFLWMYHLGVRFRIASQTLLFKACMDVDLPGLSRFGTGRVVNIFSSELWRFEMGSVFFSYVLLCPPLLFAICWLAYNMVGVSGLCGLCVILFLVPGQKVMAYLFVRIRRRTVGLADRRVQLQREMLNHARTVKMQSWEEALASAVHVVRVQEVASLTRAAMCKGTNYSMSFSASCGALALTAIVQHLLGHELRSDELFPLMALFFPAQVVVTGFLPQAVENLADLRVMDKRIVELLLMANRAKKKTDEGFLRSYRKAGLDEHAVACEGLCFSWDTATKGAPETLHGIDLAVRPGELFVLSGRVGSGKSTLTQAILGELLPSSGRVQLNAKVIAYCGQEPYVMHATVLKNIVLGHDDGRDIDLERVHDAVWASGMEADLDRMPGGLHEQIGERGTTLSGGQKARLALARAVYAEDADVVVLDDPLSALDPSVQRHVFQEAIVGRFLRRGCAVILATHQVHLLSDPCLAAFRGSTRVATLEHGRIVKDESLSDVVDLEGQSSHQESVEKPERRASQGSSRLSLSLVPARSSAQVEKVSGGGITWRVYRKYFCSGGVLPFVGCVMLFALTQALQMGTTVFVSAWAKQPSDEQDGRGFWPTVCGALAIATFIVACARSAIALSICLGASRSAHSTSFLAVMRSSMQFFEANPVGRILNRFSKDVGLLDDTLPMLVTDCLQCAMSVLGIVIIVCVVMPPVLITLMPLGFIFVRIRRFYLGCSMQLKRLEGTTRSPVFVHLSTLLDGLPTIRAFGLREPVMREFCRAMDLNFSALFAFKAAERWFGFRLDMIIFVFSVCAAFSAAALRGMLDPNLVGLSLAYAIQLGGMFQWFVRQTAEVQNVMTAAQRVMEYGDLEPEERLSIVDLAGPDWPPAGALEFDAVSMRYTTADLSAAPSLQEVSFLVPGGTSCGIVGRTGAGKSSLLAALLRLNPLSGGVVRIDGMDVSTAPLARLRSAIGVIPQQPTIFTGSVAYNLDPGGAVADGGVLSAELQASLWLVLEEVQLAAAIRALPRGLESELGEESNSLSAGQRQCLCLARAVLRGKRMLVLDEATANCDAKTDAQIQTALRSRSGRATVLAIAHRIETVLDMSNILVMHFGRVAQFGAPAELLQDRTGLFAEIAAISGVEPAGKPPANFFTI